MLLREGIHIRGGGGTMMKAVGRGVQAPLSQGTAIAYEAAAITILAPGFSS